MQHSIKTLTLPITWGVKGDGSTLLYTIQLEQAMDNISPKTFTLGQLQPSQNPIYSICPFNPMVPMICMHASKQSCDPLAPSLPYMALHPTASIFKTLLLLDRPAEAKGVISKEVKLDVEACWRLAFVFMQPAV